jgi:hypothetical protein
MQLAQAPPGADASAPVVLPVARCGCVQVRIEDPLVTAEDIQCAVQQALFAAAARSKRLRREDSAGTMQR